MKLRLVMLTIAIGFINERQVEALLECYEYANRTGLTVHLNASSDITGHFPNGAGACKVPAGWIVIFYENINHVGGVTALHTVKEEVLLPKFVGIRSILVLGSQYKKGIYTFEQKNFQGGLFKYFPGEIEDVKGDNKFGSAVVVDESSDWTIAGRCQLSNCQRRCLVCLRRAITGLGASFIKSIDSTLVRKILNVLPGACLGKKYTGISRIEGQATTVRHIPEKLTWDKSKVFLVECTNNCVILSIKTFNGIGGINLEAQKDRNSRLFCMASNYQSSNVECKGPYRIGRNSFYVKVKPFMAEVKNVTLSVTLRNSVPKLTELVNPSVAIRKDKSGKSYLEVKTGYKEIKGINYQHLRVDCNGNCKGIGFSSSGGSGDVKLHGSEEEPAYVNKNGCINNCICESNGPGNKDVCRLQNGADKFDLTSKSFWIFLEPNQPSKNVIAKVTGDNIQRVHKVVNIASQTVVLPDGSYVLALAPFKKGTYRHMEAYAVWGKAYKDIRLELIGAGKDDIDIRAGSSTKTDSKGVCTACYCQGQCKKPFTANIWHLRLSFTALKDIDDIVYVKIHGKNINQLMPSVGVTRSWI